MLVDTSVAAQQYVEDCEVCFNPIDLVIRCQGGELEGFSAGNLEQ